MNQKKDFEYSQKNPEVVENLRSVPKLLHGIYRTGLTWKDQNLGRKPRLTSFTWTSPAMLVKMLAFFHFAFFSFFVPWYLLDFFS